MAITRNSRIDIKMSMNNFNAKKITVLIPKACRAGKSFRIPHSTDEPVKVLDIAKRIIRIEKKDVFFLVYQEIN